MSAARLPKLPEEATRDAGSKGGVHTLSLGSGMAFCGLLRACIAAAVPYLDLATASTSRSLYFACLVLLAGRFAFCMCSKNR